MVIKKMLSLGGPTVNFFLNHPCSYQPINFIIDKVKLVSWNLWLGLQNKKIYYSKVFVTIVP